MKLGDGPAPFSCASCTDRDKELRNCGNRKRLKHTALASVKSAGFRPEGKKVYNLTNGEEVLRLYECPVRWITDETMDLLHMVRLTNETGVFPLAGGTADQPYWFIEACQIYSRELSVWQTGKAKARSKTEFKIDGGKTDRNSH